MRYLITGGAGFIGSHLAEEILQSGADEALVLDDLSTGRRENLARLDDGRRLRLVVGTVNDKAAVEACVAECDAVLHLASAVGVRLIIEQPVRTIENIVLGAEVVLGACARYRRPVLLASSSEVYGKGTKIPFSEEDDCVIGPTIKRRWSYACSKALDEFLALAHWHESRLPVFIARLFNTVGPRQTGQYGMVVPRFVRQGLAGEAITVYGDGRQTRCFAHVKDVVGCLARLIRTPEAHGQVVNVGSDEEVSIAELARKVSEMTGGRSDIRFVSYEEAYGEGFDDMRRRVPDLSRASRLVGYAPQRNLEDILRDVIEWERSAK